MDGIMDAAPRRGKGAGAQQARFPCCPRFQNGPRRQGFAPNLFKRKIFLRRAQPARP